MFPAELGKGAETTVFTQQEVTSEELRTDAKVISASMVISEATFMVSNPAPR